MEIGRILKFVLLYWNSKAQLGDDEDRHSGPYRLIKLELSGTATHQESRLS